MSQYAMPRIARAAALAVMTMALAAPARAADMTKDKPAGEIITRTTGWDAPQMKRLASSLGSLLTARIGSAQDYLNNSDVTDARYALLVADDMTSGMRAIMPTITVVERFRAAGRSALNDDVKVFHASMLPIYGEIDRLALYAPRVAKAARMRMKEAEHMAAAHNRKGAAAKLKEAANEVAAATVYLPLDYVSIQLHVALNAVNQKKPDLAMAKKAVANALDSLHGARGGA